MQILWLYNKMWDKQHNLATEAQDNNTSTKGRQSKMELLDYSERESMLHI